jgi:hypothetical protein
VRIVHGVDLAAPDAAAADGDVRAQHPVHGGPYFERLRSNHALVGALTGITAAVVGVIANLALSFAINTLFAQTYTIDAGPCRRACLA